DALERRQLAAVAAALPDRARHARAQDAAAPLATAVRAGARPLPARRAAGAAGGSRLAPGRVPAHAPLDARGARRLGRGLPPLLRGHRPLLPGDESGLGALVCAPGGGDTRVRGRDRPPLPVAAHALAPPGHGAVRAEAPRATARAVSKYAAQAEEWSERQYADPSAYLS